MQRINQYQTTCAYAWTYGMAFFTHLMTIPLSPSDLILSSALLTMVIGSESHEQIVLESMLQNHRTGTHTPSHTMLGLSVGNSYDRDMSEYENLRGGGGGGGRCFSGGTVGTCTYMYIAMIWFCRAMHSLSHWSLDPHYMYPPTPHCLASLISQLALATNLWTSVNSNSQLRMWIGSPCRLRSEHNILHASH